MNERKPSKKLQIAAVKGAVLVSDGKECIVITPDAARTLRSHLDSMASLAESVSPGMPDASNYLVNQMNETLQ